MSLRLRQYIIDAYVGPGSYVPEKNRRDFAIQVDDQDDEDMLEEFCTIFVTVGSAGSFRVELSGCMPITPEMADLAEIYDGFTDAREGRIALHLNTTSVEALDLLAAKIRETAHLGRGVGNPGWRAVSARTVSSLHRFVRVVKEYVRTRKSGLG